MKTIRVLLADDHKLIRAGLRLVVEREPDLMVAGEADDGFEAVEKARALKPDVVVMDIGMPRMNGYEAAECIRSQPWGQEMLLVALTGWGQDEDKRRSREAGFQHHLVKPAEPADLYQIFVQLEQRNSPEGIRDH